MNRESWSICGQPCRAARTRLRRRGNVNGSPFRNLSGSASNQDSNHNPRQCARSSRLNSRMLRLEDPGLDAITAQGLRSYQGEVDSAGTYAERVQAGKSFFPTYNRTGNGVFRIVRERLGLMCSGARRCGYCEGSVGDEVEHIKPKDLYPEAMFVWENYLLACGPSNGGKNNNFSVIRDGRLIDVTCGRAAPVRRPQVCRIGLLFSLDERRALAQGRLSSQLHGSRFP